VSMDKSERDKITQYCQRTLDLEHATLSDEYYYQSLPLCAIDAVFSIGARYEGTRKLVLRYCDYFGLVRLREERSVLPQESSQESSGRQSFHQRCARNHRSFG